MNDKFDEAMIKILNTFKDAVRASNEEASKEDAVRIALRRHPAGKR